MLHEAIFLATSLATMVTENINCKSRHRGCHTLAIFSTGRNLQRPHWKLFTTLSSPAWNLLRAKDGSDCLIFTKLRCRFRWTCHTQQLVSQRCEKLRVFLLFLQLATQHFVTVAGCKTGVLHVKSFLQLVSQRLLRDKLQQKLPRVTWP